MQGGVDWGTGSLVNSNSREESPTANFDEPRQISKSSSSFWHVQIPRHTWPLTTPQSDPSARVTSVWKMLDIFCFSGNIETAHKKNMTCPLDTVHGNVLFWIFILVPLGQDASIIADRPTPLSPMKLCCWVDQLDSCPKTSRFGCHRLCW